MPEISPKQKAPSRADNASEKMQRFKGVRMRKWGKWVSEVRVPNSRTRIWLGSHHTPQQAARAYDCALYCLRGSKAKLNFPDCPPEIPSAPSLSLAEIQAAAATYATGNFWQTSQNVAFSGSESRPCIEGQVTLAEQDPAMLDSFQQYLKSSQSTNQSTILDGSSAQDML